MFIRPEPTTSEKKDGNVSVMILGLDAVSRLNFHRHMPKTSALLSELGNVEMIGYNKVEDNTFPNLIPVLSGLSVEEFRNSRCWPADDAFFDNCRFIWDDFKNANFGTAFVEDTPRIGMFNYLKQGFFKKPTDHYPRPLMILAEDNIGHERRGNTVCCSGPRLGMTALLDYSLKIAESMSDRLYFGLFWTSSLTHDFIDYPRFGDHDLRDFFVKFNESGQLNSTIVILMSDHGIRWGDFRATFQGSLEDRLPMLRFIMPEWFKNKYRKAIKNLNENANRITTPYDLHETLLEFVDTNKLDDEIIDYRTGTNHYKRSSSLFLKIPEDRTCQTAGVPAHYCACHGLRSNISVDDTNVVNVANFFVSYLNSKLLTNYPQCANLTLHQIDAAFVEMRKGGLVKYYELRVTTKPGFAKFEATLRENGNQLEMVSSLNRLNPYGSQSICVNDAKTKLICYCKTNGFKLSF